MTVRYGPELLARVAALCEADPAREACGFVVRRGGALEVVPIGNVADREHARDPVHSPGTARDGYRMDPRGVLRVERELAAEDGAIVAVWHSHVEAEACFSARDRAGALVDGAPVLPGAEYLVLSVRAGKVAESRRFVLVAGEIVEEALE